MKSYFSVLLLLMPFFLVAQKDSLISLYHGSNHRSVKIEAGIELVAILLNEDLEAAEEIAVQTLVFSNKEKDDYSTRTLLNQLGEIYRFKGDYELAIETLKKAEKIQLGPEYGETIATTFNNQGKAYINASKYNEGLESFFSALEIMVKLNNVEGQAFYLANIGITYDLQGIYDKALTYYQLSLNKKIEAGMIENIGASYTNIAITYFNLDSINKSLEYNELALEEYIKYENVRGIAKANNNIGFAYISLKEYEKAIQYLQTARKLNEEVGSARSLAQTNNNLGLAYLNINALDSALFYTSIGLEMANEIHQLDVLRDGYKVLSEIHEKLNHPEKALENHKLYSIYADSVKNEEVYSQLAETEAKYNLLEKDLNLKSKEEIIHKKELIITQSKAERNLLISVIAMILAFIVLLVLKIKQKNRVNTLINAQVLLIKNQNQTLISDKEKLYADLADKKEILDKFYATKTTELPEELLSLSKREMEVLSFLALGWKDQEIAEKLFVSKATVKTHLRRIYSKLLVNGRAEAVSIAHKYKLIGAEIKQENE